MESGSRHRLRSLTNLIRAEPWRRFQAGLGLLAGVLAFGTAGYTVIGLSPFEAMYQTAITVTTVGFAEIGPADQIDHTYRVFTLFIVLTGASSVLYVISVLLETVVEGTLNDGLRRRRMLKHVQKLKDHLIVAGHGRVGRSIAAHAIRRGVPVVAIDQEPFEVDDYDLVIGDANDDDVLMAAGIARASSLVAALGNDPENLSITLTARSLRPDLRIVARVADQRNERKFVRAGADRVVNPYEIGGSRMGALALQPHAAQFLEHILADHTYDTDIGEVTVMAGSPAAGARLGDLTEAEGGALVVALHSADGRFVANPSADVQLAEDDAIIALGSQADLERLEARLSPSHRTLRSPRRRSD